MAVPVIAAAGGVSAKTAVLAALKKYGLKATVFAGTAASSKVISKTKYKDSKRKGNDFNEDRVIVVINNNGYKKSNPYKTKKNYSNQYKKYGGKR